MSLNKSEWTDEAKKLYQYYSQVNYDRFEKSFFKRLEMVSKQIDEVEVKRLQKLLPGLQKETAAALFAVYQTIFQNMAGRLAEAEMSQAGIIPPASKALNSIHELLLQNPDYDLMSMKNVQVLD